MGSLGALIDPEKYQVIEYAQRGTRENPSPHPVTLHDHLQDLHDQVSLHASSNYSIIGHSWGANLALLFAAQDPPDLHQVILLGTAPLHQESEDLFAHQLTTRIDPETQKKLETLDAALHRELEQPDSPLIDDLFTQRITLIEPFYHHNPITSTLMPPYSFQFSSFLETKRELWELITAGEIPTILSQIKVPVSALHGEYDVIPAIETLAFLKACISQCTSTVLTHTGHFPWLEPQSAQACMARVHLALSVPD